VRMIICREADEGVGRERGIEKGSSRWHTVNDRDMRRPWGTIKIVNASAYIREEKDIQVMIIEATSFSQYNLNRTDHHTPYT